MGWFYNKQISLMAETGGSLYRRDLIFKEYGYYIDCTYRIFCNPDSDLKEGSIVKYGDEQFKVMKIVPWDDYYDIFIQSVEVSGNE